MVWRWPCGVPARAGQRSGGLSGPDLRTAAPSERQSGLVGGGMAWGCRSTNSIARRRTACQAASVRGPSNQVLSEVLRAGRESTAGRSPLSTPIASSCVIGNVPGAVWPHTRAWGFCSNTPKGLWQIWSSQSALYDEGRD